MMEHYAAFDIEIAKQVTGSNWKEQRPLGISAAALAHDHDQITTWSAPERLSRNQCRQIVNDLLDRTGAGCRLVTWNGAGFDFDILAEESGMWKQCKHLCLYHVDLMAIVVCLRGHYLSLTKAAKGAGIEDKLHSVTLTDGSTLTDMDGSKAPELWAAGEYGAVLAYLEQDVRSTLQLAKAIARQGCVRWISSKRRPNTIEIPHLYTVAKLLHIEPSIPRPTWISEPASVKKMTSWFKDEVK